MILTGPHIRYIDRTRAYYQALGYGPAYVWAQFDTVPFSRLGKPLRDCRIGIVTTAAPFRPGCGEQGPGAAYNAAAKFYEVYTGLTARMPDLRISHLAIDRDHTDARDPGAYFPLTALNKARARGRVGSVSPRFYGLPTNRSQRVTRETDCPDLLNQVSRDGCDALVFVANCPVCHQSVSLAARTLEDAGVPSVILGCARDIVEHVGVARFLFSDFPLGNAAGRPDDPASQDLTLSLALDLLETASSPRTTWVSPLTWPGPDGWKEDYANPARLSRDEIRARRDEFDKGKQVAKTLRGD